MNRPAGADRSPPPRQQGDLPAALRRARDSDIATLRKIDADCRLPMWKVSTYRDFLRDGLSDVVVAVTGVPSEALLGFYIARSLEVERELLKIAVAPPFQGRGVGDRLLSDCLERGCRRGNRFCYLEVRGSNTQALNLYRRHGFEFLSRRPGYYDNPPEDALLMRRNLSGGP